MSVPSKPNRELSISQFKEDYACILQHSHKIYHDWKFEPYFDKQYLYVDIWAFDEHHNKLDDYHLHMDMSYYRSYPPGVSYINPETKSFDPNKDLKWFPKPNGAPPGTNIGYHVSYNLNTGQNKQMICNSMILEYYQSNHSPSPDQMWDSTKHNLFSTLYILQSMLLSPYYGGRSNGS